jgi:hypothetical protein
MNFQEVENMSQKNCAKHRKNCSINNDEEAESVKKRKEEAKQAIYIKRI